MNTFAKLAHRLLLPCSLLLSPALLAQGPLTPPGPPAPTVKTLTQVEPRTPIETLPFTITQPGSYYLTRNLTGASGQQGITVSSDAVTIDLNGFALTGVAGSISGITVSASPKNLAIRNGTIRNWGRDGISAGNSINSQFLGLRLSDNEGAGLSAGSAALVKDCLAENNAAGGIRTGLDSVVTNCIARGNSDAGILVNRGSTVSGCVANENSTGIDIQGASTVSDCSAKGNTNNGIIAIVGKSIITRCTSNENTANGIRAGEHSIVAGCTATGNRVHGIQVEFGSSVIGNTSNANGTSLKGAGVYFSGIGVRVEGNNCYDNDWGIQSEAGADGFIVRNSCRSNSEPPTNAPPATSNYDFDRASNTYGPVLTVNGDMSANAATNHPAANIQY